MGSSKCERSLYKGANHTSKTREKNVGTSEERLTGMTTDVALQFENGPNG